MHVNNESLDTLRQCVESDSSITEEQCTRDLETIESVRQGLASGEFVVVDRLSMIQTAAKKVQFRKKIKSKSRKVRRKVKEKESTLISSSLEAFDEQVMYLSDNEVREYADSMGITETYNETKRFDNEWN